MNLLGFVFLSCLVLLHYILVNADGTKLEFKWKQFLPASIGQFVQKFAKITAPLAALFVVTKAHHEVPMNIQPIPYSGSFFQGWLMRMVDHENDLSVMLIFGTYSPDKSSRFEQMYLFCAVEINGTTHKVEYFPSSESVTINGQVPFRLFQKNALDVHIELENTGYIALKQDESIANLKFDRFHVLLNTTERIPFTTPSWRPPGPEGWVAYTQLFVCRYAIHSVGSKTSYRIDFDQNDSNANDGVSRVVSGQSGFTHIEGNHGSFFPQGWVWSQGISACSNASFSLAVGEFQIAHWHPMNAIVYLRRSNGDRIIFRTIDLDQIEYHLNGQTRQAHFYCRSHTLLSSVTSFLFAKKQPQYELQIEIVTTDPSNHVLHIPTNEGFMNTPGCHETYTALTKIVLTDKQHPDWSEEYLFPHTAFEFGGSFVGQQRHTKAFAHAISSEL